MRENRLFKNPISIAVLQFCFASYDSYFFRNSGPGIGGPDEAEEGALTFAAAARPVTFCVEGIAGRFPAAASEAAFSPEFWEWRGGNLTLPDSELVRVLLSGASTVPGFLAGVGEARACRAAGEAEDASPLVRDEAVCPDSACREPITGDCRTGVDTGLGPLTEEVAPLDEVEAALPPMPPTGPARLLPGELRGPRRLEGGGAIGPRMSPPPPGFDCAAGRGLENPVLTAC